MSHLFEGICPILVTPFNSSGRLDLDSLQSLVDFQLRCGVSAVGIALASEVFKLSSVEWEQVTRVVVERAAGHIPVVTSVGAAGTDLAVDLARRAVACGVSAVMAIPPYFVRPDPDGIFQYYRAIASAVSPLPLIIQDDPADSGVEMPVEFLARLVLEAENIQHIKVEVMPSLSKISRILQVLDGQVTLIGGGGGLYMIEEYLRGARGNMPGSAYPEVFVQAWKALQAGDAEGSRATFDRYLHLTTYTLQSLEFFMAVHKEILVRRGVIASARMREPSTRLDEAARVELEALAVGAGVFSA